MSNRFASCSCGQLTAQVAGEPVRVSICHCLACQRRTGSTFGQQAKFRRDQVSVSGVSSEYVRVGDEGPGAKFHFYGALLPLSFSGRSGLNDCYQGCCGLACADVIATAERPLADASNWYSRREAAMQSEAPVTAKPSLSQR
jgi:Glutathione-dependent formaldehyde-activating enzyme